MKKSDTRSDHAELERAREELRQRTAELEIIDSVQLGLATQRHVQDIYDLIGDKIRDIFNAQVVMISIYDPHTDQVAHRYAIERGKRVNIAEPQPVGGFRRHIIESGESLLVNTKVAEKATALGQPTLPGTETPRSWLGVPMRVGKRVTGVMSLQNLDRENAFTESDLRLLQTLASSMSVAIENARLFDETQRLLKETEQRNTELAIINSVQAALASKLNLREIYEAVGDKIRDCFHNTDLSIRIYDPKTNLLHLPYNYDNGNRVAIDPLPLTQGFSAHIIRTGETVIVNENMAQISEQYGSYVLPGEHLPKSSVFVPLVMGGQTRGLIRLKNMEREHAFSESDVRLLQTLANAMSVSLENARLFDETQQRAAELSIINSVQEGLASKLDLQAIYDLVGDKIRDIFDAQGVMITSFNHEKKSSCNHYSIEKGKRVHQAPMPFTRGTEYLFRARQPVLVSRNYDEWFAKEIGGERMIVPGTEPSKSAVWVPLVGGDTVSGMISLHNVDRENAFTESDVRLLTTLANAMSVALENAHLFDETERLLKETEQRAVELTTVNRVSHALASQIDLASLIQLAGTQIRDTFNADIAYIALLDGARRWIQFPYTFGETFTPIELGEGLTSKIIETREPLLINRDMEIRRAQIGATQVGIDVRSYLGVPILVGAQAIGVVSVQSIHHEGRFDEDDQHLLMTIAANVGVAIDRAQRFQTEKRRAEQFQVIAEIGRNIASLLETNQILHQVTQSLQRVFNYYHVGIGLIEGDEVVYRVGSGALWDDPNFTFKPQRLRVGAEGLTGWVAARGEPVIIPDVTQEPRYVWLQGSATRSELITPIIVKEQIIGVLDVQSNQLNAFDQTDLAVVQSIANQTGTAIENARLYERAQELAVMQERNRLARDLHDAVTQTLFSASLIADALPPTWENDENQGRLLLRELRQLSRGALAEMRTLLLELRPAALVETPLDNLLRQLGEAMAGREGMRVTVNAAKDCKLPAEAHIAFYRIAQEALNNILKHSRASNVVVSLYYRAIGHHPIVELAISDDGRGFDLAQVQPDHFGLRNMRERAQAIGAEFSVTSQPGNGTQIQVAWTNQEVVP